jgi:NADH-quinone oxidoreductase subunit K
VDRTQLLIGVALALFAIGLFGVVVRRNVLVMLMCLELMLNGVNLSLVTFAQHTGNAAGAVLVFLVFVVAAAGRICAGVTSTLAACPALTPSM